jgi:hypothetical protein
MGHRSPPLRQIEAAATQAQRGFRSFTDRFDDGPDQQTGWRRKNEPAPSVTEKEVFYEIGTLQTRVFYRRSRRQVHLSTSHLYHQRHLGVVLGHANEGSNNRVLPADSSPGQCDGGRQHH